MPITRENWSICRTTSSCSHPDGLLVLFDPTPTHSDAIRCIGPFQQAEQIGHPEHILDLITSLTITMESQKWARESYLVWGVAEPQTSQTTPLALTMDSDFLFFPNLTLRLALLLRQETNVRDGGIEKEWSIRLDQHEIRHRAGILFKYDISNKGEVSCTTAGLERTYDKELLSAVDLESYMPQIQEELSVILSQHL